MSDPIQNVGFTVFDAATGAVRSIGSCSPADVAIQPIPPGSVVVGGYYPDDSYYYNVATAQVMAKTVFPGLPATIPVNTVHTVNGVPNPTYIQINDQATVTVTDTSIEVEPTQAGRYRVKVWGPKLKLWQGFFDAS